MRTPTPDRPFDHLPPVERLIAICDDILTRRQPVLSPQASREPLDLIRYQERVIRQQAEVIERAMALLEKRGKDLDQKHGNEQTGRGQLPPEAKRKPPQKKPELVAENAVRSRFHLDAIDPHKDSTIKDPSKYRSYPKKEILERLRKAGEEIITKLSIRKNFPDNVDHPLREIPFWGNDTNPLRDYLGTCGFTDGTLDEHTPELDVIAANVEVLRRALRSNTTLLPKDGGREIDYSPNGFLICYIPSNGKVEVVRQKDVGKHEVIDTIG